jgi:small-conductance mechanosensitive channel
MKLNRYEKWILASLCALMAVVLVAMGLTGGWAMYFRPTRRASAATTASSRVDQRPLTTAQALAQLAATANERQYAQDALRLGDHSVDLNFAAALENAAENQAPANAQNSSITQRVKSAQDAVDTDNDRVTELTRRLAAAPAAGKTEIQNQIALEQAQLALDQDALQDAQQDLDRAGGNTQAEIQKILDEHKASEASAAAAGVVGADASSIELTRARNIEAEVLAWLSLRSKDAQLLQAQQDAIDRANALNVSHDALEKKLVSEGQQNTASHPELSALPGAVATKPGDALALIHRMTQDQKNLSSFDTRIGTEMQLAAVYGSWARVVEGRKQVFLRRFLMSFFWILLITILVLALHWWIEHIFAGIALERRQLHTLRAVVLFAVEAIGIATILVIIFGVPTNFATALGLVGAGLAVGLQDFIVGFFGWFVLIGKDGVRSGDWVEINGIGGEVLELGLFHTVILETGSDAGRLTGRKVSFVNSYAVQGHYFNFSTSGNWLWDEVEIQIPENVEPYEISEAILKIAEDETKANTQIAEEDWSRGAPPSSRQTFSAKPSFSLRPTGSGVSVFVRYITRVDERHELRDRIYRAAVELLRSAKVNEPGSPPAAPPKPVNESA